MIYMKTIAFPAKCTGKEKHQAEHEAGLALLQAGLWQEFQISLPDIGGRLKAGERGKPYLPDYPKIHFNISHSGNLAVCAIGNSPLGIDAEQIRPVRSPAVRRILAEEERQYLEHCPKSEQDLEFFRFWTLKESYVKALGTGLAFDFPSIRFSLNSGPLLPLPATEIGSCGDMAGQEILKAVEIDGFLKQPGSREDTDAGWQWLQAVWKRGKESFVLSLCARNAKKWLRAAGQEEKGRT